MAQIRHEINIQAGEVITDGLSGNSRVQLDTTQYNGTVTYYFEVLGTSSSNDCAVTLRRNGTTTDDATATITGGTATKTLFRSTAFTPPAGQTTYFVQVPGVAGSGIVNAARIIVIQNATTITNTETQIEIGNNATTTSVTNVPVTNPKYWKYDASKWDGTLTAYFESTDAAGNTKSGVTVELQTSTSITAPSWSSVASSSHTNTSLSATRTRSGAITLVDGNWYRVAYSTGTSKSAATLYNAKIIVDQEASTTTDVYYIDGSDGITDSGNVWANGANGFDGSIATFATTSTAGAESSNFLKGEGTNSPTSGNGIKLVEVRTYGQSGSNALNLRGKVYSDNLSETLATTGRSGTTDVYSGYTSLSVPSGGWTWQKINDLECKYWIDAGANAKLGVCEITVTSYTSSITKLEPQYLLANTLFAAGTSAQNFLTKWDSTEWDAGSGTITYNFQSEAADNSTSDVVLIDSGGSTVTNSTVTDVDNAQISASMTMPSNQNLDVKATTNAGDIAAARILVSYVYAAAPASTSAPTNYQDFFITSGFLFALFKAYDFILKTIKS